MKAPYRNCINVRIENGLVSCANEHCKTLLGNVCEVSGLLITQLINVREKLYVPNQFFKDDLSNNVAIFTSSYEVENYPNDDLGYNFGPVLTPELRRRTNLLNGVLEAERETNNLTPLGQYVCDQQFNENESFDTASYSPPIDFNAVEADNFNEFGDEYFSSDFADLEAFAGLHNFLVDFQPIISNDFDFESPILFDNKRMRTPDQVLPNKIFKTE